MLPCFDRVFDTCSFSGAQEIRHGFGGGDVRARLAGQKSALDGAHIFRWPQSRSHYASYNTGNLLTFSRLRLTFVVKLSHHNPFSLLSIFRFRPSDVNDVRLFQLGFTCVYNRCSPTPGCSYKLACNSFHGRGAQRHYSAWKFSNPVPAYNMA